MIKKGLISVLIPCYNGEKFLNKSLTALLNQTYDNYEVITVDDGSTDKSKEIIARYREKFSKKDKKLVYLYQKNSGQAVAINTALKQAQGEYLVWQDVDDYYEPDALENLYNYLSVHPDYDFVRGAVTNRYYGGEKETVHTEIRSKYPQRMNVFNLYLYEKDAYCYPGIFMVRAEYLDKCIKNRRIYETRAGQNWQLILPIAYRGKCGYLDKPVYNYSVRNDSHSRSAKSKKEKIKRCDAHKDLLLHVLDNIESMNVLAKITHKIRLSLRYLLKKLKIIMLK
ncbi:glycosyltransferase family 2 protein [Candidatus Saccharibacteria bacterium]|nr:glycosyltransferase family 2 protein [Candidatus Saccharibacteria bacterium]